MKVLKNFEDAKFLSKSENGENERFKLSDESFLQTNEIDKDNLNSELSDLKSIDLDYETIHSEILENIIFDENDSGLSDFEEKKVEPEEELEQKIRKNVPIFDIIKIKNIIHKSVTSLFEKEQENDEFKPLAQQEKEIQDKLEVKIKDNKAEDFTNDTEIKTQDITEDVKEKSKGDFDNFDTKKKDEVIKENQIVNFRRYNYLTDPNSNYNNFTKKYEIKTIPKKRFRDIHPFLKSFNPKFLKKENIDKKIFRRFRKFVKILFKKNRNLQVFTRNPFFWKKFYLKNLLPPVKIILNHNGKLIEHKSFNTQYLIWLFNQDGTTELFEMFAKNESENVINNFIEEYDLNRSKEPDIVEKLKKYIKYIPEIYRDNNDNKRVILEEEKENLEVNYIFDKDDEDLKSIDSSISSSNPFNLRFDTIEKKEFKESPYEENNLNNDICFNSEEENNFNEYLIRKGGKKLTRFNFIDGDYFNEPFKYSYYN